MKNLTISLIYLGAFLLVAACSPESANMYSEKPLVQKEVFVPEGNKVDTRPLQWITLDGGQGELEFNPKLDILFVTDNSDSMRGAQANLVKNIDRFTKKIIKNKMIDYHIGVLNVWDSSERYKAANAKSYGIGELHYIKDSKGKRYNQRFVTKNENKLLASTLNIGVMPFDKGGPENEEIFSPLAAALDKSGRGAVNEDFFRQDAQLVVILLTDADDSSKDITADEMAKKLLEFKGGAEKKKLSVYGVLVSASDDDSVKDWSLKIHPKYHPECFDMTGKTPQKNGTCRGFGPENIESFIIAANNGKGTPDEIRNNNIMKITSPRFGDDLGKIGDSITAETLRKEITLPYRPIVQNQNLMIEVYYGKQKIPQSINGGWAYNPDTNSIVLDGNVDYQYEEGAKFVLRMLVVPEE